MFDLGTHHLQKREVAHCNVIKVDLHVDPKEVASVVLKATVRLIIHNSQRHKRKVSIGGVDALPKLP